MYNQEAFIEAVEQAYRSIDQAQGSTRRSPARIRGVQSQVLESIRGSFAEGATAQPAGLQEVVGFYHRKNFPIVVRQNNVPALCIGTTLTLGGYESNIINYFQSILGESVNLQQTPARYASIQIIPTRIRRRNNNQLFESLNADHFTMFYNLMRAMNPPYTPLALGCAIVEIDYASRTVQPANLTNIFSEEQLVQYRDFLSMDQFFDKIEQFCQNL